MIYNVFQKQRVLLSVLAIIYCCCSHGCSTTYWYGDNADSKITISNLYTLTVREQAAVQQGNALLVSIHAHKELTDYMHIEYMRTRTGEEKINDKNKAKLFYEKYCSISAQFNGDTSWLKLEPLYPSVDENGNGYYSFTCENFEDKAEQYKSVHISIRMSFEEGLLKGETIDKQEFTLQRQKDVDFFRLAH